MRYIVWREFNGFQGTVSRTRHRVNYLIQKSRALDLSLADDRHIRSDFPIFVEEDVRNRTILDWQKLEDV
jgi:hypothetical protein